VSRPSDTQNAIYVLPYYSSHVTYASNTKHRQGRRSHGAGRTNADPAFGTVAPIEELADQTFQKVGLIACSGLLVVHTNAFTRTAQEMKTLFMTVQQVH